MDLPASLFELQGWILKYRVDKISRKYFYFVTQAENDLGYRLDDRDSTHYKGRDFCKTVKNITMVFAKT